MAAALRAAQLDRLRSEPRLPMDAWAGFVVLGDGNLVPFPGGRRAWPSWLAPTPAGVAIGAAALITSLALLVAIARIAMHAARRRCS